MLKAVRKNKSYDKRKLIIYDNNDMKIVEVTTWCMIEDIMPFKF